LKEVLDLGVVLGPNDLEVINGLVMGWCCLWRIYFVWFDA